MLQLFMVIWCIHLVHGIQDLTEKNFDEVIKSHKNVLVQFHAPWCGYCKEFRPIYDTVAEHFKNETDLVIAKVDAEKEFKLTHRFRVTDLPALRFFSEGDKVKGEAFEGDLDEEDVEDFVKDMMGGGSGYSHDDDDDEELVDDEDGDWGKMLDDINAINDILTPKSTPAAAGVPQHNKRGECQRGKCRCHIEQPGFRHR